MKKIFHFYSGKRVILQDWIQTSVYFIILMLFNGRTSCGCESSNEISQCLQIFHYPLIQKRCLNESIEGESTLWKTPWNNYLNDVVLKGALWDVIWSHWTVWRLLNIILRTFSSARSFPQLPFQMNHAHAGDIVESHFLVVCSKVQTFHFICLYLYKMSI